MKKEKEQTCVNLALCEFMETLKLEVGIIREQYLIEEMNG
jgi:hypothetical protein